VNSILFRQRQVEIIQGRYYSQHRAACGSFERTMLDGLVQAIELIKPKLCNCGQRFGWTTCTMGRRELQGISNNSAASLFGLCPSSVLMICSPGERASLTS